MTLYTTKQYSIIKNITGQELTIEGENAEPLMKSMEEYCDFLKTMTVVVDQFLGEGGDKAMVFYGYHKTYEKQRPGMEAKLKKLLASAKPVQPKQDDEKKQ